MKWVIAGVVIGWLLGGVFGVVIGLVIAFAAGISAEYKKVQAEGRAAAQARLDQEPGYVVYKPVRDA